MNEETPANANVVAPPPLIYAGALAAGLLLQQLKPMPLLLRRIAQILGLLLSVLSLVLGSSAARTMRRANTNLNPYNPTTAIVSSGPFRFTRNPIYVSFTMLYIGIALLRNAPVPLLLLPGVLVLMTRGVIEREERYLEQIFGATYTDYKATVRRWL